MYIGDYDPNGFYCPNNPMDPFYLSKNCTSFIYDAQILFDDQSTDDLNIDYDYAINDLLDNNKSVYLFARYEKSKCPPEAEDNTDHGLANIQRLLKNYTIAGFILFNLNFNSTINCDDKLKQYVNIVKQFNSIQIGLYVNAKSMIDHTNDATATGWFDFEELNNFMDYYIIGFEMFNPCNDQYKGGIIPLNNVQNSNYSLTTLANVLNKSKIAKDKIYLLFPVVPTVNDTSTEGLPECSVAYKKYCENDHYNKYWCADNADSLYQKGKFAKDIHAKGIIVRNIDAIDPTATCDCNNQDKFISFTMMLRGYLGEDPIKDCAKLNSITDT
ncbi:uncharacterized protein LOC132929790 isoform X3 [Rhopalosiphum padi]|nr:uncharacterized protein LOC132929790 isoform X3 [Rhopalosiphum padi]